MLAASFVHDEHITRGRLAGIGSRADVLRKAAGGFAMPQDLDESYHRVVDGFAESLGRR